MGEFLRVAWLVAVKDLTVEVRSREILSTTVFFAISCVLVFAFALVKDGRTVVDAAAGILWIAIAFSGTLALGRTFERERYTDTLRALMLAPAERPAIYVGKLIAVTAMILAAEALLVPLVALLFQAPLFDRPVLLAALLGCGTLGFAAVGTLFAAMLVRARSRDVLLPVLLYPITIPVIIGGVRGTAALVSTPADVPMVQFWIGLLAFFDVVFVVLSLWTFEPLMTD
jgi:heme exporter protein CcmB